MRPLIAHDHLGLGKRYRRTDKRERAQEHFATAVAMYREMGMTYWAGEGEGSHQGVGIKPPSALAVLTALAHAAPFA
jgi:hypothetical protein